MLIKKLREINRQFPVAGMQKPSQYLQRLKLKPYVEITLDSLGIREYSRIKFPANGFNFDLTVRTSPHWNKLERKEFERDCIDYISGVVTKDANILDIGAGFGTYSMLFSKFVGSSGKVYAFEPDPVCNKVLRDNLKKNKITNVYVDNRCASRSPGKTILRSKMWGMGLSTIMGHLGHEAHMETTVKATTLDDLCEEKMIRPHGLKIDVEGAEGLVLQGARRIIEDCNPWLLLEFHGGFMSNVEMKRNWNIATSAAEKIVFLDGNSNLYAPGDEIHRMPDCAGFHVFIQY